MSKFTNETVSTVAREMKSFIRSNLGRRAHEDEVRDYFNDGDMLSLWIDDDAATQEEAEEAFEIALASHLDRLEIA